MNNFEYVVDEATSGLRLDKTLVVLHEGSSRQELQNLIKGNNVSVNGTAQKSNYKCKVNDKINIIIPEPIKVTIDPQALDLEIVYEDESIIVINKPKGMLVHPTSKVKEDTLVNGLLHHSKNLSTIGGIDRSGIVHRLDQDTSGLIIAAKNDEAHVYLQKQFRDQSAIRIYETIVYGVVPHNTGIIKAPIGRNPKDRLKMAVVEGGKLSETHFTVLERFEQYTHLQCELKTGRTHQIRVHLKYMNHPVVGDKLYTRKKSKLTESQALFAKKLSILHPDTNELMTFEVERPDYFEKLLLKLKKMT